MIDDNEFLLWLILAQVTPLDKLIGVVGYGLCLFMALLCIFKRLKGK